VVEPIEEGACRVTLRAESTQWLDSVVAMLAVVAEIEVVEPADVAARVAGIARRLAVEPSRGGRGRDESWAARSST